MQKSQSSVEFIILIAFVLFFFTLFIIAIEASMADKVAERKNMAVKEIALAVQDEINLALKAGDGYYREFKISEKIAEQDYSAELVEDMVYVRTLDGKNAIALPIPKVKGQIVKGANKIRKENGEIFLNQ